MRNFFKDLLQRIDNIGTACNYLLRDTEDIISVQQDLSERLRKVEDFISQLTISEDLEENTKEAKVITQLDGSEIIEPTKTIDSVQQFTSVDDIDASIKAKATLELHHNG